MSDAQLGAAVRELLTRADLAAALRPAAGRSETLALVVRTAARVLSARAASLFLIDDAGEQLVFEVAIGPEAAAVSRFAVPIGHGIAGAVAATGQPLAISGPEQDPRFAAEIARSVGYLPQSILCVPLRYGDTVIGVLEVLDKAGQDSFSPEDIEILTYFAELAARTTEQVRRGDEIRAALAEVVGAWAPDAAPAVRAGLLAGVDAVLASARTAPDYQAALELAGAIDAVARFGETERALCLDWLRRFGDYLNARTAPYGGDRPWSR